MKPAIRHTFTFILALAILAGYTGIPLSKMICREDGHIEVALSEGDSACDHETTPVKSCCKPQQKKEAKDCCDFDHSFFKIYTNTLVQQVKNEAGYQAHYSIVLFSTSTSPLFNHIELTGTNQNLPPPDYKTGSSILSLIQVFRI